VTIFNIFSRRYLSMVLHR